MLVAVIPLIFAIVGILIYAFATNPKLSNIGMWVFITSWHVTMMVAGAKTMHLLG